MKNVERERFWEAVQARETPNPQVAMAKRKDVTWIHPEIKVLVRTLRGEEKLRHATILALIEVPQAPFS